LFWVDHAAAAAPGSVCPYLRVSFGGLDEAQILEGMIRIGAAIKAAAAVTVWRGGEVPSVGLQLMT
jgi:DNA-binding transcriptional MocR family regulator